MTPIIRRWVIHLREKCALKVLYAYIHNSFFYFFFIFRFPDSSLDYYTITVNLIHKKVVCFNSWTISIRVQQSLTTMDYLCRHVRPYFLLDVGMYILTLIFSIYWFYFTACSYSKKIPYNSQLFFSNLLTPFIMSRSQLKAEIAVVWI